jgi:UDP-2-acetamido-2-deoxy-ribo-hexuluronate aminotransferase
MSKISLFQNQRNWSAIKNRVWELTNVVHSTGLAQNSDLTTALESKLAKQYGRQYCVTTASCTDALIIALLMLDLPASSKIAVSTMTFVASAHAITRAGHVPVAIDVDKNCCIDSQRLVKCDATMAVDVFGNMSDWSKLDQLNRPVICDAAQSLESHNGTKWSVQQGLIACTSFAPSKPISSWGSGGALFTDSEEIAQRAKLLRLHGKARNSDVSIHPGMNSMMSSFEAACVLAGLEMQPIWHQRRTEISQYLIKSSQYKSVMDQHLPQHSYSKLVFCSEDRDVVRQRLLDLGIETAVHYQLPVHQELPHGSYCPNADQLSKELFTVPNQHTLTDSEVERIAEALK